MLWLRTGTFFLNLKFDFFENWQIRLIFPQKSFECVETIFFQVAKRKQLSKLKAMI